MHQPVENTAYGLATHDLWDRLLGLMEQDLEERRSRKLFVEVRDESVSCEKEIGELSAEERQSLQPVLREHVMERLLDRHLAEQGRVDLVERRRPYTREIRDLTPEDLPALIAADRSSRPAEGRGGVSPRANGVCSRGASGPGAVLRRGTRRNGERDAAMK
jgi:hypothetical protein